MHILRVSTRVDSRLSRIRVLEVARCRHRTRKRRRKRRTILSTRNRPKQNVSFSKLMHHKCDREFSDDETLNLGSVRPPRLSLSTSSSHFFYIGPLSSTHISFTISLRKRTMSNRRRHRYDSINQDHLYRVKIIRELNDRAILSERS